MEKKKGYIGSIANVGSQRVEAPAQKGTVRFTGNDLRTGTGATKGKRK